MPYDLSRVAVIVPSLHPEAGLLLPFLKSLREQGFRTVILVDEGSGAPSRPIFDLAQSDLGCIVLRHETNRGKGRALKTAFEYCSSLPDVSAVVTADSDGQHSPADLQRVAIRTLEVDERTAVFGVRRFDGDHVPRNSRFGNTVTSRVVKTLFGQYVSDTQTGLRGFPIKLATESTAVRGERFEYEMNVLLWLLGRHLRVDEVPIETIYHDLENSVSHFRPIRDSARIYGVIFKQFGAFALSSVAGAGIDLAAYALIVNAAFHGSPSTTGITVASVSARLISSLANYALNRKAVFEDRGRASPSLARYYTLAAGLLAASTLGTAGLAKVLDGHVVWAKVLVDGVLFIASYLIQKRWVFADRSLEE